MSADYLLGITDTKKATDADLPVLRFDDDTIELLKNGHFNHRLLCEIIKHPAFEKYMADIELYVNGIATSQIHTLNSLVDFARQQVMENYHPDEDEFAQRELNVCYVDEYEFCRNVIQSDLGEIIKDLRKSHAGETETAPETSIVEGIKSDLEAYKNFKGSRIKCHSGCRFCLTRYIQRASRNICPFEMGGLCLIRYRKIHVRMIKCHQTKALLAYVYMIS